MVFSNVLSYNSLVHVFLDISTPTKSCLDTVSVA